MEQLDPHFRKDIENIQSLDIVPSILELICRTTGMGFAAVARVTEDKWIACAVKDEINFGLKPGSELQLQTTICNEIRGHGLPVVIDEVAKDEQFWNHHTPKMYGFQSYISIPIFLKDGRFFGTLCAIDPRPFSLKASNMVTMFNLFADLISYHLQSLEQMEAKATLLEITETKLQDSLDDIRQYAHISRHTLQEPLRKLRMFSDLIVRENALPADHKVKVLATKINTLAADFAAMIHQLTEFSETTGSISNFRSVDLNEVLDNVLNRLRVKIMEKNALIKAGPLHTVPGIPHQLNEAFYYLLDNALNFTRPGVDPVIKIYSLDMKEEELQAFRPLAAHPRYCKVCFEDNGIGINNAYMKQIFDLFARLNPKDKFEGLGMGLSQSKRIMRNHDGAIFVQSKLGEGSVFSLVFPLQKSPDTK
jgi:signal transduction histidine kinase